MAKGGGDGWIAAKPTKKGGKVEEPKISKIPVTKVQVKIIKVSFRKTDFDLKLGTTRSNR